MSQVPNDLLVSVTPDQVGRIQRQCQSTGQTVQQYVAELIEDDLRISEAQEARRQPSSSSNPFARQRLGSADDMGHCDFAYERD